MNPPSTKLPWTIGIGLLLLVMTVALLALLAEVKAVRRDQVADKPLPVIGPVADFALTNQAGAPVSMADLRGRVWVADIIFTRCPGPCLRMTHQMKELQDALPAETKLVSLTTDPDHDTMSVLKTYALKAGADAGRWMFLTGSKQQIAALASGSLKLTAQENPPSTQASPDDLFIHSTMFVVVDKQGRLRSAFQTGGEGVEWALEKKKILAAVRQLEREK